MSKGGRPANVPIKVSPRIVMKSKQGTRSAPRDGGEGEQKIRFCVGSPVNAYASVWVLFVRKSEVYLARRNSANEQKVSLHSSGVWRIAYTSESGKTAMPGGDRVLMRWSRPQAYAPGWTQGPSISVLHTEFSRPFGAQEEHLDQSIRWCGAPGPGHKTTILVLFSSAGIMEFAAGDIVGSLKLSNGETVWLTTFEHQMDERELEIARYYHSLRIHYNGDIRPKPTSAEIQGEMNGQPSFIVIPLGDENVVKADERAP